MSKNIARLMLLFNVLLYGIVFSITKMATPHYISPNGVIMIRGIGAFLVFEILVRAMKLPRIQKSDYSTLFFCTLFGIVINQLSFFGGISLTTPITASIINTTTPVAVFLLAWIFFKERLTWVKSLGLVMGLGGAILLIFYGKTMVGQHAINPQLGNTLVFINAISYAIYSIISKKMTQKYHPFAMLQWMYGVALVFIIPVGFNDVVHAHWDQMPLKVYGVLGYIVFILSCVGYAIYLFAIKYLDAKEVSMYIYLQPFFAALVAVAMGMDHLDAIKMGAGAIIFMGIYLVSTNAIVKKKPSDGGLS